MQAERRTFKFAAVKSSAAPPARAPRATFFDFDGVIADTEPLHYEAFAAVLARRGIRVSAADYARRYLGFGTDREALRLAMEDAGRGDLLGSLETLFEEKRAAMAERIRAGIPLYDDFRPFLDEASRRGPVAVVSGALRAEVAAVLESARIAHLFTTIVAAEDVRRGKPDPEGYRIAWRRIRDRLAVDLRPAQCLAVEDSPNGVAAAKAAGLRTLALTHGVPAAALAAADRVVPSYAAADWSDLARLFDDA